MDGYYTMPISKIVFSIWLVISIIMSLSLFSDISAISGVIIFWIITLYFYLDFKSKKYYYNDEKIFVETGILNKKQNIIPLYRIINITAQDNILGYGNIWIEDKGQTITLKSVLHSKSEMLKLLDKWENAKKQNVRNEVI